MADRHYVLLATDGYTNLSHTNTPCDPPDPLQDVYIIDFVGRLFR